MEKFEKLMKFFPLMPAKKDTLKFVLALLFYVYVPILATGAVAAALTFTFILAPVGSLLVFVGNVYALVGVLIAIAKYTGYKCSCCE